MRQKRRKTQEKVKFQKTDSRGLSMDLTVKEQIDEVKTDFAQQLEMAKDEGKKVVRRDILHRKRIRIQLFYGPNGNPVQREFFDEDGNKIDSKSFFIPLSTRGGYQ